MSDELAFRPPSSHSQSLDAAKKQPCQQHTPHASAALKRDISTRNKHKGSPAFPEGKNKAFRPFDAKSVTFSEAREETVTSPGVTDITSDLAQGHIITPSISECSKASPRSREDLGQPDPSIWPRYLAGYEGSESEPPMCKFVVEDEPSDEHTRGQEALTDTPDTHAEVTAEVITTGAPVDEEEETTRFPCNQDEMDMSESELDFDALAAADWLDVTYAMLVEH